MITPPTNTITFTAFHGGSQAAPEWFSTDRSHAAQFGAVAEYRITARVLFVSRDDAVHDKRFCELEAAAHDLADVTGCVAIRGWEGAGHCILVKRWLVSIEWVSGAAVPVTSDDED